MRCHICGTKHPFHAPYCTLCGVELLEEPVCTKAQNSEPLHQHIENVDISQRHINPKKLAVLVVILLLLIIPGVMMFPVFRTPEDVLLSRQQFSELLSHYSADSTSYDHRAQEIVAAMMEQRSLMSIYQDPLSFRHVPLEALLSFFINDLYIGVNTYPYVAFSLSSQDAHTIILSKYHLPYWFPFSSIISLELSLDLTTGTPSIEFTSLRKGKKILPTTAAWRYFDNELKALRYLETFVGGITSLEISPHHRSDEITLSWEYDHTSLPINAR